jgi:hypothetical protein
MKCNKTQSKWCINKHEASKIIDTLETYHILLLQALLENFLGTGNDGRNMERQLAAFSATHNGSISSYPVNPAWYDDTAATYHLTNNLDKLTMKNLSWQGSRPNSQW